MFNVVANPEFSRTVTVHVPDGEGTTEQTMEVRFLSLGDDEMEDLNWNDQNAVKEYLRRVVRHIGDLVGEGDEPVDFSKDVMDAILARPYARIALLKEYTRANTGAVAGN